MNKTITPKVSICCPCYNSKAFIKETVLSFVNQTFTDLEIIISDDNSPDGTFEIIKNEFNDPRIKLFRQQHNLGPSGNMEFVLQNATSEYIAICAGDDVMDVDRVKKTYNFMQENPDCDMVYTFANIIDKNSNIIKDNMEFVFNKNKNCNDIIRYFFYDGNYICAPSAMVKKSVFEKLKFNNCLLQLQDFDMWIRMLLHGYKITCLPEKLTNYRVHDNNLSLSESDAINRHSRHMFEHVKTLQNFTKYITTKKQFEGIFKVQVQHENLIPFMIAQEALSTGHRGHYLFALETIYHEMLDDEKVTLIRQYCSFEIKDFYTLCNNFEMRLPSDSPRVFWHTTLTNRYKKLKNSIRKRMVTLKRLCTFHS